jgi:inosine-uridine nucleoside N-ribohydrolase
MSAGEQDTVCSAPAGVSRRLDPSPRFVAMDTDCFYDPDDAISMVLAALLVEKLIVVTCDETVGRRARGARRFLDLLGRPDVPVVAGAELDGEQRFIMDDLIPDVPDQSHDLVEAVAGACAAAAGQPVYWVGQGPMSNLAEVFLQRPELAERLAVVQQGGWLDEYRDPTRASHNFRLDETAAGLAVRAAFEPKLLLSDHTNADELLITRESELYRLVSAPDAPEWARWIALHLGRWFDRGKPSHMHDPLALSVALDCGFVQFAEVRVRIEADARMYRDRGGRPVAVSTGVAYEAFMQWLTAVFAAGIERTREEVGAGV